MKTKKFIVSAITVVMALVGLAFAPTMASAAPAAPAPAAQVVQVSTVPAAAYASIPLLQNTPASTTGSGCLTAADGTITCSFVVQGNWNYSCFSCSQPYVGLTSGVTTNHTGRCIELYANRLINTSNGQWVSKGNGGMQLTATAPTNSRVTADSNVAIPTAGWKLAQSWKACSRDGLSGSASALSGNGYP